jgi:hypothetical protein
MAGCEVMKKRQIFVAMELSVQMHQLQVFKQAKLTYNIKDLVLG